MSERPIIFSAPMVRAILKGRKTQTRRVVRFERLSSVRAGRLFYSTTFNSWAIEGGEADLELVECPHGKPGDRLWVRETWRPNVGDDRFAVYRADFPHLDTSGQGWKSSIYMPRERSRITLQIANIRVQQLQDITEEDASAEGFESCCRNPDSRVTQCGCEARSATYDFMMAWDSIHGKGAWDLNPFVWVLEFHRV